jgi:vacuolar-type H+-ATPase subunit H
MKSGRMVQNNPIEQVRDKERAANQRRITAERACESIMSKAHEGARKLQTDGARKGQQAGQRAFDEGLSKAHSAADERVAAVEAQVAEMADRSESLLQQSVEWALALILSGESGGT